MAGNHKFSPEHADRLLSADRLQATDFEALFREIGVRPRMTVADLGCGNGFFTLPLAEKVGPHGTVYAVDVSPEMLDKLRDRGVPDNVQILLSGEEAVPLETDSVDLAVASNMLHEVGNRPGYLLEIRRILRESGRLWVLDWLPLDEPQGPPKHHRLAPEVLEQDLRQAGFDVLWRKNMPPSHYHILAQKRVVRCGC